MYLGCIHDWHINIFGLYGKWQLRTGENECIYIFFFNVFICQCMGHKTIGHNVVGGKNG